MSTKGAHGVGRDMLRLRQAAPVQGPVKNDNARTLVQKLLRISRQTTEH